MPLKKKVMSDIMADSLTVVVCLCRETDPGAERDIFQ